MYVCMYVRNVAQIHTYTYLYLYMCVCVLSIIVLNGIVFVVIF